MPISDDHIVYFLSVEDIRHVASEECNRDLSDDEIRQIENRIGDYIGWYEAILSAIQDISPIPGT